MWSQPPDLDLRGGPAGGRPPPALPRRQRHRALPATRPSAGLAEGSPIPAAWLTGPEFRISSWETGARSAPAPLPRSQVPVVPKAGLPPALPGPSAAPGPPSCRPPSWLKQLLASADSPSSEAPLSLRGLGVSVVGADPVYLSLRLCPWSPARRPWACCVQGPKTGVRVRAAAGCSAGQWGVHRKTRSRHGALGRGSSLASGCGPRRLGLCPNCWEGDKASPTQKDPQPQHLGDPSSPHPRPGLCRWRGRQTLSVISEEKGLGGREAGGKAATLA